MNCDQVFDILTRGPFPAGEPTDDAVEWHLEGCDECRRLAEALRPAVELLHEAIIDDEAESLPGYSGRLVFDAMPWDHVDNGVGSDIDNGVDIGVDNGGGESKTGRVAVKRRPMLRRSVLGDGKTQRLWRFAAAVALGVMLALGLNAMGLPDGKNTPPGALPPHSRGLGQLVALGLPSDCFEAHSDAVGTIKVHAVTAGQRNFQCCARCHAEGRARLASIETTSKVVRSCQVCHSS
jgi:hypothetical protein